MGINIFDGPVMSWSPDAVEPQLCLPATSFTVKLSASITVTKGAWLAEVTATPGVYGLYVHLGAGGLGVPKCIAPRAYVTDSGGNIFEGAQASSELPGESRLAIPAWFSGCFRQGDVAFDANTLADLLTGSPGAHILRGSIANTNALFVF